MRYLFTFWAVVVVINAFTAALTGWRLLRVREQLWDYQTRVFALFFAMVCFGGAIEAAIARLTIESDEGVRYVLRACGRAIEMAPMLMMFLKLQGFLNGRTGAAVEGLASRIEAAIDYLFRAGKRIKEKIASALRKTD